jgi:CheY-like chemotaxis protein
VQKEMTRQGHEVETASDGEAAWELLEEKDFDVLLCDINMPRLDGIGLLRRLREKSAESAGSYYADRTGDGRIGNRSDEARRV